MPYLAQIHQTLPRLLALFDNDAASATYGMGDRFHWAWGLIDFGNGTFQGAANGLARLLVENLLPDSFTETHILKRIDSMFTAAGRLRRKDGSMEEAFPYEGSFCVTALVAYDLLTAVELLNERLDAATKKRYLSTIQPMINYLQHAEETHAFISNHLATAVAALFKWCELTGDSSRNRAEEILGRIFSEQSEEGWYREYEGADPGYQTLCSYYLADVMRMRGGADLKDSLVRSMRFLWHFAHLDGSFGGIYGSRNTRFYYPAGVEFLAAEMPEAAALAKYMRKSIARQSVVSLMAMDEPNLIPMFNSYCWAAVEARPIPEELALPSHSKETFRRYWPASGLLVERGAKHYTIVSGRKGGVVYHYRDAHPPVINTGLLFKSDGGTLFSTQSMLGKTKVSVNEDEIVIESEIKPVTQQLPKPWQFIILRLLNITLMRFRYPREKVKQMLVKMLISGEKKSFGINRRVIHLGFDLKIQDQSSPQPGLTQISVTGPFSAIHMASQGYWQAQDEA